ncbi:MAG: nodulation protein [Terriglobia bacterium]|nr:MAG: nodulation protein [Terriglobia bacterium]
MTSAVAPSNGSGFFLGIFEGNFDPAVALVHKGKLVAYSEEERHIRVKHAYRVYPIESLKFCLKTAGIALSDVEAVGINWNMTAHADGTMATFFDEMKTKWKVDPRTISWQRDVLRRYHPVFYRAHHEYHWRREFGELSFPPLQEIPHHYTHAFHACMQSPFDRSLVVTIDGSGDQHCTVLWRHVSDVIEPIYVITMPHSLGWFYAAFTEYLGFRAYDGEYKVMGLAAYGSPDSVLQAQVGTVLFPSPDGVGYELDPTAIHYGERTYSDRFTDILVDRIHQPPRIPDEKITQWHENLAFAVQDALERAVIRLVRWGIRETGIKNICVGGGVGHNVKLNSTIFELTEVDDVFAQPLCNDAGGAAGAALATCFRKTGIRPERLQTLALGRQETNDEIETVLKLTGASYHRAPDICSVVAKELAEGRIVGWFQGRMEGGPRALGQRSILADPRRAENRDRVNAIIKFREYWRPFCPSMPFEVAGRYLQSSTDAPFMVIAFRATEELRRDAPAIVHVDGTCRVQLVKQSILPKFHRLLTEFDRITGVPVILNTSFNVKGEPIVCSIHDALRTFWSTGLDVLAAEDFLVKKPCS